MAARHQQHRTGSVRTEKSSTWNVESSDAPFVYCCFPTRSVIQARDTVLLSYKLRIQNHEIDSTMQ
jgi:hypothetical protein